jgi:hypothetical protein
MKLPNYVSGQWKEGTGAGEPLVDPVTGEELARISSQGADVGGALEYARSNGGATLQELTYRERADLLGKLADVLTANRDEYFRISLLNQGANQADASSDLDGAIYTIKYYAKIGRALAEQKMLKEGVEISLSKTNVFSGQHFLIPAKGAAVSINAFGRSRFGQARLADSLVDATNSRRHRESGNPSAWEYFHPLRFRARSPRSRSRRRLDFIHWLSRHGRAHSLPRKCAATLGPREYRSR